MGDFKVYPSLERVIASNVGKSPVFKAEVNKFASQVRAKASAEHGSTVARGINVERIESDPYGRIDWFVTLTMKDRKGRDFAGGFEFGHAYNFWQAGEVPDHGFAARRWIPGTHFMSHQSKH